MMFDHITLNWTPGSIYEMSREAIGIAKTTGRKVSFTFNKVTVNVTSISDPEDVSEKALRSVTTGDCHPVFGKGWY